MQSGFFDISKLGNWLPLQVAHFWVKELDLQTLLQFECQQLCMHMISAWIIFWQCLKVRFGPVFQPNFDGLQPQQVSYYGMTQKTGPQKTRPNRLEWQFCCNLFKPTKTEIFVVFYT